MFPRLPAVVGVLAVIVLAACTGPAEPGPGPSGAPTSVGTPSPSPSRGAKQAQEAIEAYRAYQDMIIEVGRAGGYDISKGADARPRSVRATTMGKERDYVDGENGELKRRKERFTKAPTDPVMRVEVVESVPEPGAVGGHRVKLAACIDNRIEITGPDGVRGPHSNFLEMRPTLYFDDSEPAGWKVAVMESKGVERC